MASPANNNGLEHLLDMGLFSDMEIKCRGSIFKVHRAILYGKSDFFRAACGGSFKVCSVFPKLILPGID